MVRINIEEIKGITDDRKKSSCATSDNAAGIEKTGAFYCKGDKCQKDWHKEE